MTLPAPLAALARYPQFVSWRLEDRDGAKPTKVPVDISTGARASSTNPATWAAYSPEIDPVGFVFTEGDPFFFLDIDDALQPDSQWAPLAVSLCERLAGAAVEVSPSGTGLHIIGTAAEMPHRCKNVPLGLELYTQERFTTITGSGASGSAELDCTMQLASIIAEYFPPIEAAEAPGESTLEDAELLAKARASRSASSLLGAGCSFEDLWTANTEALAKAYPSSSGEAYDASSADAALCQHLAFWTNRGTEQIKRIMQGSALRRDKWDRDSYIEATVAHAVGLCSRTYEPPAPAVPLSDDLGAPKLRASSDAQRAFGDSVRGQVLAGADASNPDVQLLCAPRGAAASARFWIENQGADVSTLAAMLRPVESVAGPYHAAQGPARLEGLQYLTADLQLEHFRGCVYIQDLHRIFTPTGDKLNADRFNSVYGGYLFQLDEMGDKTTRKAWEAFTESQVLRMPKAQGTVFDPALAAGAVVEREGRVLVNTYVAIPTRRVQGDPAPFLDLLGRMLPNQRDREILLAYMAACVQHKGVKFQWAPLLQGTEGNGKTLFTRCIAYAIGRRYTHFPKAADIDNKFNGWLLDKLFIGVEDIYVPEHRREVLETLKPMITGGDGIEIQLKGVDQITADICANFMLNSNHKDAIRKTESDRRFAVFYTAQQTAADMVRDGTAGDYFPLLYKWLRADGYAIVSEYLHTYAIPDALNPATDCHRAPATSSTAEAVTASLGGVEQEILEAVESSRVGFAGGWISSMQLDTLLSEMRATRAIPHNKRREVLRTLGYVWHPGLTNGRVNRYVATDGGKPKLFVKVGHLAENLRGGGVIADRYEADQAQAGAAAVSAMMG